MKAPLFLLAVFWAVPPVGAAQNEDVAMKAINSLGIDLLHKAAAAKANAVLSPYSIQSAMAMACAGADGQTHEEMARVLHYPAEQSAVDEAFSGLQAELNGMMERQAAYAKRMRQYGMAMDPLTLTTANRLFGQSGFDFRPAYLALLKDTYQSPFEPMDFADDAAGAAAHINGWVEQQTHNRIRDLLSPRALNRATRLVLVNAIYLKAPWSSKFREKSTEPRTFNLNDGALAQVSTMMQHHSFGYERRDGYQVVAIPYSGEELQFVILLPDALNGLPALEGALKPEMLAQCAQMRMQEMNLYLPKFKLEPPSLSLGKAFQALGMKTAFDLPPGSANFDRMAPRLPDRYLYISDVIHKAFLNLDETGTEAAAATAVPVAMAAAIMRHADEPLEVRVDHPFLFAIQHRPTGACLFLGHVVDPR